MKYRVTLEGQEREVDIHSTGSAVVVRLDGEVVIADIQRVGKGVHLLMNGRSYDIAVGGRGVSRDIAAGRMRITADVISDREGGRKRRGGSAGGAGELRSPMPGRIVAIEVEVGSIVSPGDALVVMEAMKMQNELRSEVQGVVSKVEVAEDQNVEAGALLVTIDVEKN